MKSRESLSCVPVVRDFTHREYPLCATCNRHPAGENPTIGCIVLTDVFFIDERDWFEAPGNWWGTVTGKSYAPRLAYAQTR